MAEVGRIGLGPGVDGTDTEVEVVIVDHDPTSVATDCATGSLIINRDTSNHYRKLDDGSTTNVVIIIGGGKSILIPADAFENPNNDDWIVNSLAPPSPSANNLGLTVRKFPDVFAVPADESGVGWKLWVPSGATTMRLRLWSAADTAPAGVRTVGVKLYYRKITDGVAPSGTWAGTNDGDEVLTDIDITADELPLDDEQTLTLASLTPVIPADELYQFELTRIAPAGGTELTGDWDLYALLVEFA